MQRKFRTSAVVLTGLIFMVGCSNSKEKGNDTSGGESDLDSDSDNSNDNDTNVGDAGDIGDVDSDDICDVVEQGIGDVTVKVMLLQDISSSMSDPLEGSGTLSKWDIARQALTDMVTQLNDKVQFGLDFFPFTDQCTVGTSVAMDAEPNNAADISARLASTVTSVSTPLYLSMSNFLNDAYAPLFVEDGVDSYLIVISDGMDSCGTDGQFGNSVTAADLTSVTSSLLNENGIRTFVIGFGSEVDPDQLNAVAQAGGTEFTTYFDAQDSQQLNEALSSIGETVVVSCRYQLGAVDPSADLNLTNIYFDGDGLARGDACSGNADWMWGNTEKTIIEFCPAACDMLESGQVQQLQVIIMCDEGDVILI